MTSRPRASMLQVKDCTVLPDMADQDVIMPLPSALNSTVSLKNGNAGGGLDQRPIGPLDRILSISSFSAESRSVTRVPSSAAPSIRAGSRPYAVLLVDVAPEVHRAVLGGPGGDVGEVERDRLFQLQVEALARLPHFVHLLGLPALVGR